MAGLSICPDWHQSVGESEKRVQMCSKSLDVETLEKTYEKKQSDTLPSLISFIRLKMCNLQNNLHLNEGNGQAYKKTMYNAHGQKNQNNMQTTPQRWKHSVVLAQ